MNYLLRFPLPTAIGGLLFASFLFVLPGSAFPSSGWMAAVQFDKWVHVTIFSLLCFFWGTGLKTFTVREKLFLFAAALLYGLLVEVVQGRYVPNRSFDPGDVVADAGGAVLGLWLMRFIKK
jgi:VanZ family protein